MEQRWVWTCRQRVEGPVSVTYPIKAALRLQTESQFQFPLGFMVAARHIISDWNPLICAAVILAVQSSGRYRIAQDDVKSAGGQ